MSHGLKTHQVLFTLYPRSTHVSVVKPVWVPRKFRILAVRDSVRYPLSVEQFLRRPMTRRSRYLVRVRDLETGARHSVYHRSLRDWYRETPLRVGIYDGSELKELLTTNWGPSVADRLGLVHFLQTHGNYDMGDLRLGILSDDGEAISCESLG